MSQFTNTAENKLADYIRGQGLTLPANWYVALGSAATDAAFTELSGTGYARVPLARSLANWAGTQGPGTTLASTGASHESSNNVAIDFGVAGAGGWGSAAAVGLYDAASGGNCWLWAERAPVAVNSGDSFSIPIGGLALSLGLVGGMSNYLANKMIDMLFRAQGFLWPASIWSALYTAAPTNAGGGTEVSAPSYARAPLAASLAAISGTQGAGTTTASSGSGGKVSNNLAVQHPSPAEAWGTVTHGAWHSAAVGGSLLFWGALPSAKTINAGMSPPRYDISKATFTFA